MSSLAAKKQILEGAGYLYHFSRMIYFNRNDRKIFSIEAVEDNDENWLKKCIEADNSEAQWKFYFNSPFSESVKQELIQELS